MSHKLTPREWHIYEYLKDNCVGINNAKKSKEICEELMKKYPSEFAKVVSIKVDIHNLRNSPLITRQIGSNSQVGYWMAVSTDRTSSLGYTLSNCLTYMRTLLQSGIPKEIFYKVLNNEPINSVEDLQGTLHLTKYQQDIVHTLSDDLLKENNG